MPQLFRNNARALLASGILAAATTLTVEAGKADRFPVANTGTGSVPAPTDWFKLVLQDSLGNVEIMYVRTRTAGSAILSNVIRGQEGTTARNWDAGTVCGLRITAVDIENSISLGANAVLMTGNQSVDGAKTFVQQITASGGIAGNLTGNAATVTNGVYTTGDQTIAGVKTWSGQQVWGGAAIHNYSNVVSTFTGIFGLGGRNIRKVTASNSIEVVNQANSAVTLTLADNGDLTASGNITAFSDERLKKDWDTHYVHGGLMLNQLPYVLAGSYTRTDTGERQLGVSAQQLRRLMPEAVLEGEDGTLSVAYGNAALVACVALAAEVMALRERVQALEVA